MPVSGAFPEHESMRSTLERLPAWLKPLFWDHAFEELDFAAHRDFVLGRILSAGDWGAVQWLRGRVGEAELRSWIERREGRGLTPQQLRFWELLLKLPGDRVDGWLALRKQVPSIGGVRE